MVSVLAVWVLRLFSRLLGVQFYDGLQLGDTFATMYDLGVSVYGSGFVTGKGDKVYGVYFVRYVSNVSDNLEGRWN
jgi:hypothetical protein